MKKLIRIGDMEFIGEEIPIDLPEELSELIINNCSKEELKRVMDTQIQHENYEGAQRIKDKLNER